MSEPVRNSTAQSAEMIHPKAAQSPVVIDAWKKLSVWHFVDASKPWVLVPNGSLGGHFDWVPEHLRVGPWSSVAFLYLIAIWYAVLAAGCYFWPVLTKQSDATWWWDNDSTGTDGAAPSSHLQYPAAYSGAWYYHTIGFAWMLFIMHSVVFHSPLSYRAWATYTIQSWTLLCLRHGMCALTPWIPQYAIPAAEILRFPCAVAHTVTFVVWNFALVPYMLGHVFRHDAVKRRNFIAFCTNFRLSNLHFANILLCVLNIGPFGSPRRRLQWVDLYLAAVSAVVYLTWYTCVLDRIGVHLYPIFSPRLRNGWVLVAWTSAALLYLGSFYGWRRWLTPLDEA